MAKSLDPWSDRQQRHLSSISEFTTDIQHVTRKDNIVADALSRININTLLSGANYETMAAAQQQDVELQNLRVSPTTSLKLKDVTIGNTSLLCDVSGQQARPVVPLSLRRQVFDNIMSEPLCKPSKFHHGASTILTSTSPDRYLHHKVTHTYPLLSTVLPDGQWLYHSTTPPRYLALQLSSLIGSHALAYKQTSLLTEAHSSLPNSGPPQMNF